MRRNGSLALSTACLLAGGAIAQTPMHIHEPPPSVVTLAKGEVVLPMGSFGGRPTVDVTLDGRGPYTFVLDTSASGSVVDTKLAQTLKIPTLGDVRTMNGARSSAGAGKLLRIDTLGLDGVSIAAPLAVSMDLSSVFTGPSDPVGVLSASLFSGYLLTLDYPGKRIVVRRGALPPADEQEVLDCDPKEELPTIRVAVGDRRVAAHLDSGASRGLLLPTELASSLPLSDELEKAGTCRMLGKLVQLRTARLKTGQTKIGRHVLDLPALVFADGAEAGLVGYEVLRAFEVTFDQKNHRVRFHAPDVAGS